MQNDLPNVFQKKIEHTAEELVEEVINRTLVKLDTLQVNLSADRPSIKIAHFPPKNSPTEQIKRHLKAANEAAKARMNAPGKGRRIGSVKSEDQKKIEKSEFETQIKNEARQLVASGQKVNKTALARAMRCGGVNAKGSDTSLPAFRNKLRRLNVDYDAILADLQK